MHTKRIIPCLDVNAGRVVKGVNFVNLIDAGDPVVRSLMTKQVRMSLFSWTLPQAPMREIPWLTW